MIRRCPFLSRFLVAQAMNGACLWIELENEVRVFYFLGCRNDRSVTQLRFYRLQVANRLFGFVRRGAGSRGDSIEEVLAFFFPTERDDLVIFGVRASSPNPAEFDGRSRATFSCPFPRYAPASRATERSKATSVASPTRNLPCAIHD